MIKKDAIYTYSDYQTKPASQSQPCYPEESNFYFIPLIAD